MTLASPPLLGWASYDYRPGQSFCFCHWELSISYTFFMVLVCFGGPCSVMSFCYYNILRQVRMSRKRLAAGAAADAQARAPPPAASATSAGAGQQNGGRAPSSAEKDGAAGQSRSHGNGAVRGDSVRRVRLLLGGRARSRGVMW